MSSEAFEKELQQRAQKVENLLGMINEARETIPESHGQIEMSIKPTITEAERELVELVGEEEFKRLTGREYLKENL